jgi:hypothetical protein
MLLCNLDDSDATDSHSVRGFVPTDTSVADGGMLLAEECLGLDVERRGLDVVSWGELIAGKAVGI